MYEELYEQRLSTDEIGFKLRELDWHREPIHADSEDPRTIRELKKTVAPRIFGKEREGLSNEWYSAAEAIALSSHSVIIWRDAITHLRRSR